MKVGETYVTKKYPYDTPPMFTLRAINDGKWTVDFHVKYYGHKEDSFDEEYINAFYKVVDKDSWKEDFARFKGYILKEYRGINDPQELCDILNPELDMDDDDVFKRYPEMIRTKLIAEREK